jgi:hypothetical protein
MEAMFYYSIAIHRDWARVAWNFLFPEDPIPITVTNMLQRMNVFIGVFFFLSGHSILAPMQTPTEYGEPDDDLAPAKIK